MGLFPWIPKVETCCFCVTNLRMACFIIIFLVLIGSCGNTVELWRPICAKLYEERSPVQLLFNMIRWIYLLIEMVVVASSLVFLLGIVLSFSVTGDIFICSLLAKISIAILYFTILAVHLQYARCKWYHTSMCDFISLSSSPIVLSYYVVVVNSYIDQMDVIE